MKYLPFSAIFLILILNILNILNIGYSLKIPKEIVKGIYLPVDPNNKVIPFGDDTKTPIDFFSFSGDHGSSTLIINNGYELNYIGPDWIPNPGGYSGKYQIIDGPDIIQVYAKLNQTNSEIYTLYGVNKADYQLSK